MGVSDALMRGALERMGPTTIPIAQVGGIRGTAFLFNELLTRAPQQETVRTFLVTCRLLIENQRFLTVEVPPYRTSPPGVASREIVLNGLDGMWRVGDGGIAIGYFAHLEEHAASKGWAWDMTEVTDGIAIRADELDALDAASCLVFGFAGEQAGRAEIVFEAPLVRNAAGWEIPTAVPAGLVGGPVVIFNRNGEGQVVLKCLGLVLSGNERHPIATFDVIRALIASQARPSRRRRWPGPRRK